MVVCSGGLERDQGGRISRWCGCCSSAFVGANGGVSAGGDLNREWRRRSASTSPGDAGKQAGCVTARAHAALRARWPRWTGAP